MVDLRKEICNALEGQKYRIKFDKQTWDKNIKDKYYISMTEGFVIARDVKTTDLSQNEIKGFIIWLKQEYPDLIVIKEK